MQTQGQVPMQIREHSHSADPQPVAVALLVMEPWRIQVDLRFPNSCLADAGTRLLFLDLQGDGSGSRLLRFIQRPAADGCMEMWQPTIRSYGIGFDPAPGIENLLVMDWNGKPADPDAPPQMLGLSAAALDPEAERADSIPLKPEHMFPGFFLPSVEHVEVVRTAATGRLGSYRAEFRVRTPDHCRAQPQVHLIETRTGISDRTGQAVIDWLFLLLPEACRGGDGDRLRSFSMESEMLLQYPRRVGLLNPPRPLQLQRVHR